jgi:hypothetical protein
VETFSAGAVLSTGSRVLARSGLRVLPMVVAVHGALLLLPEEADYLTLLFEVLFASILSHAAFRELRGAPASIVASITAGLRRAVPAVCVMVLIYVVVAAVVIALALPLGRDRLVASWELRVGFASVIATIITALYSRWFVVVPAIVLERPGITGALARSGELTAGHRLRIAAVLATIGMAHVALFLAIGFGADGDWDQWWIRPSYVAMFAGFGLVRAAMSAAAYHLIRTETEAQSPEQLAKVFD